MARLLGLAAGTASLMIGAAGAAELADLVPAGLQVPSAVTGTPLPMVTFVWGVTNQGMGPAEGTWADGIYFSRDGTDWSECIANGSEVGPIPAGGSYWHTNLARVPVWESGTYYFMLRTDVEGSASESDTNNNASLAVPIAFTIFQPDLVPLAFLAPSNISGGPFPKITVAWGVTNQGVGAIGSGAGWGDRVYFSTDPVLDGEDYPAGDFHQSGPLAVGASYWVTNTIPTSARQSGTYYLILETDSNNALFESETNNNLLVVPVEITVQAPDLAAIWLDGPQTVTGEPNPLVTLVYGVTNQGIGPAVPLWSDKIYLSTESVPDPGTERKVWWTVEEQRIEPGGSYWRTNTFHIRVVESGTYYLTLASDDDDTLGDADRSNNRLTIPVQFEISVPDLAPLALQAPDVVTSAPNGVLTVRWEVANQGSGAASLDSSWTDRLYLSGDATLDSTDTLIAALTERGLLGAGAEYWRTNAVSIPSILEGTYYLILQANAEGSLYETDTNNNQLVQPVTFVMHEADLAPLVSRIPTQITGPPRPTVTLAWGATNQSSQPAFGSQPWSDNVYFSTNPVRDGHEIWISESKQSGPVAPWSTCWHTNAVRVPVTTNGTYYFLFETDGFDGLRELDEGNNQAVVEVAIEVRPPDLAPAALQAPSSVVAPPKPSVTVVWGVTNQGIGPAIGWTDRLYLSKDITWDATDPEIAQVSEAGPAQANETYWRTNTVVVPVVESGIYYLIFKADANNSLYESDEGNNSLDQPLSFEIYPPDLAPLPLTLPSVVSGPPNPMVTMIWGVTNRGSGAALSWTDRLYVSTNGVWDAGDVEITNVVDSGPLQAGEAYWRTNNVRVPVVRSGTYYVILKADADASLYELDEGNNVVVSPMIFEVLPPDLAPLVVTVPTNVIARDPFTSVTLVWGVTNQGAGPAIGNPVWRDRVYLARQPVLREGDDELVASTDSSLLQTNSGCLCTNTVNLRVFWSGPYYLFFKADTSNALLESNETNNVVMVPISVSLLLPAWFARDKSLEFQSNGDVALAVQGTFGTPYALESSSNLVNWVRIGAFTCTNSPMWVMDPQGGSRERRFYRIETLTNAPVGP